MSRCCSWYLRILVVSWLFLGLFEEADAVSLGDRAPQLTVEKWIKGAPVTVEPGTNVFVIEFWATWCPPCRTTIPHLTNLQKKYGPQGLVIVGISSETAEEVAPFVEAQGENMSYRVAVDPTTASARDWMAASNVQGIPYAFVVNKSGLVVWHGLPDQTLEATVEQVITGKYNLAQAQALEKGERALNEYRAMLAGTNATAKEAAAIGERILGEYSVDWRVPFLLARIILSDPAITTRDLALANRAAIKAADLTQRQNYVALETLARAFFANGKTKEAVEVQKQAITVCSNPMDAAVLKNSLTMYEKAASGS